MMNDLKFANGISVNELFLFLISHPHYIKSIDLHQEFNAVKLNDKNFSFTIKGNFNEDEIKGKRL